MRSARTGRSWRAGTFRFRDPLNKERRFIPLRLDDAPIKGSLAQFLYINWLPEDREQEYAKLLEACRPPAKPTAAEAEAAREQVAEKVIQLDYKDAKSMPMRSVRMESAPSPAPRTRLCGCGTWRRGAACACSKATRMQVWSVAWSADQRRALSGSDDKTVRLWDVETGRCLRVLEGHTSAVWSVAWSADQRRALSGAQDKTVRLWDVETGRCLRVLEGHTTRSLSVAWSADQRHALSGSDDKTVRLWDVETGRCLRVLEGHTGDVWSVAWSADQRRALSGCR